MESNRSVGTAKRFMRHYDADATEKAILEQDARVLAAYKFVSEAPDFKPEMASEVFGEVLRLEIKRTRALMNMDGAE